MRGKPHPLRPTQRFITEAQADTYLVHPVLAVMVLHTFVQRPSREHQDKVSSRHDTLDELVLELAGFQLLYIDEDAEAMQLQVHLQEAAGISSIPWPGPKTQSPPHPPHLASWEPELLR